MLWVSDSTGSTKPKSKKLKKKKKCVVPTVEAPVVEVEEKADDSKLLRPDYDPWNDELSDDPYESDEFLIRSFIVSSVCALWSLLL